MSGSSDIDKCPECGKEMFVYMETRPYLSVAGECLNCGFGYYTHEYHLDQEQIEELKEAHGIN